MHPVLKIIMLICMAIAMSCLQPMFLVAFGSIVLLLCLRLCRDALCLMLKRTRWLILVLILVYALSTPGEYMMHQLWLFAPTYEGLRQGALQALRLLIMLAGVALLLSTTSRESLITSLYLLFRPLGNQAERFAVRLWLTLDYVESNKSLFRSVQIKTILDEIARNNSSHLAEDSALEVALPSFKWQDWLMLGMIILTTGALYAISAGY